MPEGEVAPRFRWMMEQLPLRPGDHVLEVGCGHGVALSLLAAKLPRGHVLGIDRSPTMTAAATKRNADAIRAGRVVVRTGTLADVVLGPAPFDVVVAMNVSAFTRTTDAALGRVRAALAPGGRVHVFYEAPAWAPAKRYLMAAKEIFASSGFAVDAAEVPPRRVLLIAR